MGSWSESCGFSGLEIGEGDVAYCLLMNDKAHGSLNDGAFQHWSPTTTLIRGTYNDYGYLRIEDDDGVLALFNKQASLELKNGDNFSLDMLDGRPERRWWIHGAAFDFLPSIEPEFPYARDPNSKEYKSIKIANIGEAANLHLTALRNAVTRSREKIEADRAKFGHAGESLDLLVELAIERNLRDILGYRDNPGLTQEDFQEVIESGADIEPHLESYRRPFLLGYAMGELRRNLGPSEGGPQHGGHVALRQFGNFIIGACDLVLAEYDEAAGDL
jgi:hypothetical protein